MAIEHINSSRENVPLRERLANKVATIVYVAGLLAVGGAGEHYIDSVHESQPFDSTTVSLLAISTGALALNILRSKQHQDAALSNPER